MKNFQMTQILGQLNKNLSTPLPSHRAGQIKKLTKNSVHYHQPRLFTRLSDGFVWHKIRIDPNFVRRCHATLRVLRCMYSSKESLTREGRTLSYDNKVVFCVNRPSKHFNVGRGVWSITKKNVLCERNCHVTEKSEAIACARRCRSSQLTEWWTQKD
jgi:hypothetical protein